MNHRGRTDRPPRRRGLWLTEVVDMVDMVDMVEVVHAVDVVEVVHVVGVVEVVPVADLEERRALAEVARLFDLTAREPEALGQLDGCVALLREVQAAKAALTRLSPAQLRAGLAHRRQLLAADSA